MLIKAVAIVIACLFLAGGCSPYRLMNAGSNEVAGDILRVTSSMAWNRTSRDRDNPHLEHWTLNGRLLDTVTFVGGVANGRMLFRPRVYNAARDNPVFRVDTIAQDMPALLEEFYRDSQRAGEFAITSVGPARFLGQPGSRTEFQLQHEGIAKRGVAVWTVIDARLYMMILSGANEHYFEAVLPEFQAMAASATLRDPP